uniref:Uncharacterized protein n=1 Tax=Setaria digitata TaxID=48799 RepID=A0A915Q7E9_9BILA
MSKHDDMTGQQETPGRRHLLPPPQLEVLIWPRSRYLTPARCCVCSLSGSATLLACTPNQCVTQGTLLSLSKNYFQKKKQGEGSISGTLKILLRYVCLEPKLSTVASVDVIRSYKSALGKFSRRDGCARHQR